ncbi:hypothetical protein [Pseudomonas poae]|uniref:DUF4198 domain-containing protein n=1 Tax=Pseudomonas poae TaxID=200451 RepID=A0A2S9EXQ2_9PSED|nr:hypothetical protein [Pseudomonas poae]PRA29828.1 hypothetical protein CQZ97_12655 [Pseudomonas poae]PRC21771.1 hypothetical protein CQZ99_02955 [Pseudomonas poae]
MLKKLSICLLALACSGAAYAHEHATHEGTTYSIPNPLRPGAKAPYCEAQPETADGCTFHSVAGGTYSAHLSTGPGEHWVAIPSDADTVKVQPGAAEGKGYQVIELKPNPTQNADATVTFDKLSGDAKLIERRRVTVMIHPA